MARTQRGGTKIWFRCKKLIVSEMQGKERHSEKKNNNNKYKNNLKLIALLFQQQGYYEGIERRDQGKGGDAETRRVLTKERNLFNKGWRQKRSN